LTVQNNKPQNEFPIGDVRNDPIGVVSVGEAMIAPCSVVINDVPAGATVVGNPAKIIKQ